MKLTGFLVFSLIYDYDCDGGVGQGQRDLLLKKGAFSTVIRKRYILRPGIFQHTPTYWYAMKQLPVTYHLGDLNSLALTGAETWLWDITVWKPFWLDHCHLLKLALKETVQGPPFFSSSHSLWWCALASLRCLELSLEVLKTWSFGVAGVCLLPGIILLSSLEETESSFLSAPYMPIWSRAYRDAGKASKILEESSPPGSLPCPCQLDELLVSTYCTSLEWEGSTVPFYCIT